MEETMKNATTEEVVEGQMSFEAEDAPESELIDDAFKTAVEEQLEKVRLQNLFIGFQTACKGVLDKIIAAEVQPGKWTMNDYKRLIKDIKKFCTTGLSNKINADGTTTPIEESAETETVQN